MSNGSLRVGDATRGKDLTFGDGGEVTRVNKGGKGVIPYIGRGSGTEMKLPVDSNAFFHQSTVI
ncbi:hypothetical protein SK128_000039, partial [Halocaridina rubra]